MTITATVMSGSRLVSNRTLPAMPPILVCLATRENEAGSELMVDGEHICGWIALHRAAEIGELLLRLRNDFRVKLTEEPVGFEMAVVATRRETHCLVCADRGRSDTLIWLKSWECHLEKRDL